MKRSEHAVIVVPGHKISEWYDRAAERCATVMIELGSTLTEEQRIAGLKQLAELGRTLDERPPVRLRVRYPRGRYPDWHFDHRRVQERWEGDRMQSGPGVIAIVETAKGVCAVAGGNFPVVQELWFGPMDFCADTGLPWRQSRTPLELHAIAQVALAAKGRGKPFVAGPCFRKGEGIVFWEAYEDFASFGASQKGALDLEQVDEIERAWEAVQELRHGYDGDGIQWRGDVLYGPALHRGR